MNQPPASKSDQHRPEEAARPIEADWTIDLESSRESLWPLLADTSSFNRRLGLPEMEFEEIEGRLHGSSGRGLLRQDWVEVPWQWENARSLTAERQYSKGPARAVRVRYELERHGEGTRFHVHFVWTPRTWWSRPVLRSINRWLRRRYERVLPELDRLARQQQPPSESKETDRAGDAQVNEVRLERAISKMAEGKLSRTDVDRLANFIRSGSDERLFRIRPKQLAFEWGMDLEDVLSVLLRGARAGLLRISWDVMCPHCQGVRTEARSLGDLREFGRCDVCDIDFGATGLDSIEVTFRVVEEVRAVREVLFCSAEPAKKPHILAQHWIDPGDRHEMSMTLTPGRYRVRPATGRSEQMSFEVGKSPGGEEALSWPQDEASSASLAGPRVIASRAKLKFFNTDEKNSTLVVLEKLAEDPAALRPSEIFNLQQFRDLFSEESLASGLKLEVGHQSLLFTDIVGSSKLYRQLGDTKAFNTVHAHFVCLQEIVGSNHGAVVKTIGDAMMAAFGRPEDALAAAVAIQQRFAGDEREPLTLRASLHRGICLAVKLEANIDYFGSAVNDAAKMQSLAGAREIVMSDEFYSQPGISEQVETLELELRDASFSSPVGEGDQAAPVKLASLASPD